MLPNSKNRFDGWRIPAVLRVLASREGSRIDLALARGGFVFAILLLVLPVVISFPARSGSAPRGVILFHSMLIPSAVLLQFLAIRLGSDSVGDQKSGLLELLSLTGTTSVQWLLIRCVQMWVGFLSVWVVRIPFLALAVSLGGVSSTALWQQELVLLAIFAVTSALSVLLAHRADSRRVVMQQLNGAVFGIETLLYLPQVFLDSIESFLGISVPAWMQDAGKQLDRFRFAPHFRGLLSDAFSWTAAAPSLWMYAGIALSAWGGLALALYSAAPDGKPEPRTWADWFRGKPAKGEVRVSRRSWDQALAWQAYAIHSHGRQIVRWKIIIYATLVAVIPALVASGFREAAIFIPQLLCVGGLIMATNKPGDCLMRELKDQTLTTLLLTPHEATDIYDGWRRGSWLLCWPDLIAGPILMGVAGWLFLGSPGGSINALHVLTVAGTVASSVWLGILTAGPFMMLSPLVPFSFKGIVSGLVLVGIPVAIAIFGIILSSSLHPQAFLYSAIPLWCLFNYWLRVDVLPRWLSQKLDSLK